jgi:hypothetical protein
MGLDIIAYSKLEPIAESELPEDPDERWEQGYVHAFAYASFPRSTRGLVGHDTQGGDEGEWIAESWYRPTDGTEMHSFAAGSYSGYSEFRRMLAGMLGHDVAEYWNDPSLADEPMYELINFADNEGCIGPDAAADLLADFREHRERWVAHIEQSDAKPMLDYYVGKYDDWITAFELAADGGLVAFH